MILIYIKVILETVICYFEKLSLIYTDEWRIPLNNYLYSEGAAPFVPIDRYIHPD